jgi:hypothetical protein
MRLSIVTVLVSSVMAYLLSCWRSAIADPAFGGIFLHDRSLGR